MPLLPIDLQIMFSQLGQVGKTEAVQRQVVPEAQALQGMEFAKRTEAIDSSVNETNETSEGPEAVREDERKKRRRRSSQKDSEKGQAAPTKKEVFEDPDLGHHIDITG